jgi:hypothetical protein
VKVIDFSVPEESAKKSSVRPRFSLPFVKREAKAQDLVIKALNKILNNQFILVSNLTLGGLEAPISQILVGPTGMWVIYASATKGVFRASQDSWEQMDDRTHQFKPGRPNYLERLTLMSGTISNYLSGREVKYPEIEPVLFFSNPGVHVDATHPAARIVLADGLDRFGLSILQSELVLEKEEIQRIIDVLEASQREPSVGQEAELRDGFSFIEDKSFKIKLPRPPSLEPVADVGRGEPEFAKRVTEKVPFSGRQWKLLGLLLVVNIVIIAVLILVVVLLR